jgi:hypothetical protein
VKLKQQASGWRTERTVKDPRWPTCIRRLRVALATASIGIVANDESSSEQVDLLPMVMDEWSRGKHSRIKAQQSCAATRLFTFVNIAGQNFLFDPFGITRGCHPPRSEIERREFQVRFTHSTHAVTVRSWSGATR